MKELKKLFNPESIVIVGASEEAGKVGNVISRNILELGYEGEVLLVNPKHDSLFGRKCYKDVSEIGKSADLGIIAIPAKFVNQVIASGADRIKNWVVVSAGFSEIGQEGKDREEELLELAREKDLNILGPNCLGFIVPSLRLNASFAGGVPEKGNISFVSQSGALAVALMDLAEEEGLSFSNIISVGNKMDIGEARLIDYLDKDEDTKVIGLYLEGIKEGSDFLRAVENSKKPVVVLKAGKTEKSQKAISSHTGSLAGDDEVMEAVFREKGIIRAENIEEFVSLLKLISKTDPPKNEEVVVLTNAGGLGVLTTDSFRGRNIRLGDISLGGKEALGKILPEESSLANPVDLLGDAGEERYGKSLEILDKEKPETIICLLTPQNQTPVSKISEVLAAFSEKSSKGIVSVFMGGKKIEESKKVLGQGKIANFLYVDEAVSSLEKYFLWNESKKKAGIQEKKSEISPSQYGDALHDKLRKEKRRALYYQEAKELFSRYDLDVPAVYEDINPGIVYPAAVKVDSPEVLHKTDQGALRLGIPDEANLSRALSEMKSAFPGKKLIIQPMMESGTEMILGSKKDPVFGPVIMFGLGGIYTEALRTTGLMLPKTNKDGIPEEILKSRIGFLFKEFRGKEPHDLAEFSGIIANLSRMVMENDWIEELDINPAIVYRGGKKASLVDVKVVCQ